MRVLLFSILLAMVQVSMAQAPADFVCKQALLDGASEGLLEFRTSPYTNNYDLSYHRMEWRIDPAQFYISGQITSYFRPTQQAMDRIYFDLSNNMEVHEVSYHGQPLVFSQHDNLVEILFPASIPNGILDSLSINYEGAPQSTGFGSFVQTIHDNAPVIWTLSEPYGARDWWPCKLDLNDKLDSIDVIVHAPQGNRVGSNGVLVEEYTDGNEVVFHWRHRHAITAYLVGVAVTNYSTYTDIVTVPGGDPIEMVNYVYPENLAQAQQGTAANILDLQLYNQLYGLYPFADEKYGHAQFSWGGGMEHQTMSFVSGWSHSLLAHELAHQWYGDKVTCGSWQDIWLNEGFATYSEGMTYEHGLGGTTFHAWLQGKINQVTQQPGGSVWVPDTTSINRIFVSRLTYAKGALVLHMLRWKLGDADFFQGLRNYNSDPNIAYKYARTDQLKGHLEAQSGLNLDGFFSDWFYGQGYPSYTINWGYDQSNQLAVTISQSTSHPSVDFFEMPVPLQFKGEGQDSIVVFDNTQNAQQYTLNLPFHVEEVVFDPDLWIVSANNVVNATVGTTSPGTAAPTLELYPNPVENQLFYRWTDSTVAPDQAIILNMAGQLIRTQALDYHSGEIDVQGLAPGMYLIKMAGNGGIAIQQFLKK